MFYFEIWFKSFNYVDIVYFYLHCLTNNFKSYKPSNLIPLKIYWSASHKSIELLPILVVVHVHNKNSAFWELWHFQ